MDPELELMFPSLIDVIGLVVDPGTSSAWLEREPRLLGWILEPRLLGWNLTAWLGTGTGTVKIEIRKVLWEPVESGSR